MSKHATNPLLVTKAAPQGYLRGKILVRKIPPTVHSDFKSECARKGVSMNTALIRFMRRFSEKGKRKTGEKE